MLLSQLELIYQIYGVPISVFDLDGTCKKLIPDKNFNGAFKLSDIPEWTHFSSFTNQVCCLVTDSLLLLGFIPDFSNKQIIVLGPATTVEMNSVSLKHFTGQISSSYSKEIALAISSTLASMKLTDLHQFKATLSLIESLLGVEIHDIKTINEYSTNLTQKNALEKVTNAITTEINFDDHDYTDTDIQDRILFYISHGMVENLENLVIPEQFMESMNRLSLRYAKNSLIVLNSLSQRAALSAGVPLRSTDSLGRAFSDQIESSPDVESLIQLSARMFIPAAYARLVRDVNIPGNTSRDIRTVIIYVQNHFREQITVKKLAELVNLSEEHLSRKFKSETGMTLKSFIVKEKIHEAEALLRFTDLSLSSISEILSFSSQSWFQTAFKKQTGKTPMEYRKEA